MCDLPTGTKDFRPSLRGVCAEWQNTLSPQLSAGECGMTEGPHSTKLPQSWDTGSDQSGVPAFRDSECPFGPLGCGAVCASCSFGQRFRH